MNDKNVSILKHSVYTKVLKFVLLTIATDGIHSMMWLYLNKLKMTEKLKNSFIAKDFPLWFAVVIGFDWLLIALDFRGKIALQTYSLKNLNFSEKLVYL